MYPRNSEALERRRERQEREDRAPRLAAEFPRLKELRLMITFKRGETTVQPQHTRVIVVSRAPALFHIPCIDPDCRRGGHEMSEVVLSALRAGRSSFSGAAECTGELGSAAARCTGELLLEGEAVYD